MMNRTQIYLTEEEQRALRAIADLQGATQSEIIREALDQYIVKHQQAHRVQMLRKACGIWANRDDIDTETLRTEWDRQFEGQE
ncbi:MAG TPA: ribbon-helix-helix domain-containing protein [Anaerolineae bacterium]|nr:ribbon-helix-helix domain-containing protein [Anaerolineae bacterium]HQH39797.1 ribbon-helix-helix domain-containing protein [Anaerolineae bacterium]